MRIARSIAGLLLAGSISTTAIGAVIDQSLTLDPGQDAGGFGISSTTIERYGQEFVPTFSSLDYAAAGLGAISADAVFVARIYQGSLTGNLVGTSESSVVPAGAYPGTNPELTAFLFASPIALTPGEVYVLEIVAMLGAATWTYAQADFPPSDPSAGYDDGRLLVRMSNGTVSADELLDFTFATGRQERSEDEPDGRVPEPSTALLLGLGFAGAALARRRRT